MNALSDKKMLQIQYDALLCDTQVMSTFCHPQKKKKKDVGMRKQLAIPAYI